MSEEQNSQSNQNKQNEENEINLYGGASRATELFEKLQNEYPPMKQRVKKEKPNPLRIRQRPHKAGEYPSSVFIPLTPDVINQLRESTESSIESFNEKNKENEYHEIEHPHITLSKEFTLREYEIPIFVKEIRKRISQMNRITITTSNSTKVKPFSFFIISFVIS